MFLSTSFSLDRWINGGVVRLVERAYVSFSVWRVCLIFVDAGLGFALAFSFCVDMVFFFSLRRASGSK